MQVRVTEKASRSTVSREKTGVLTVCLQKTFMSISFFCRTVSGGRFVQFTVYRPVLQAGMRETTVFALFCSILRTEGQTAGWRICYNGHTEDRGTIMRIVFCDDDPAALEGLRVAV